MLEPLRRIVQAVNRAGSLEEALQIIVSGVKQAVGADVCSVYLTDDDSREHVLRATDGLESDAVGLVRLPLNRGLIGWVAERADIVNVDDADSHPCYLYVPDTGEASFHGFLGVPILQNRRVLGVLVLRQRQARCFDDDTVSFVITLAAQLAAAIALARSTGELAVVPQQPRLPNRFLAGLSASPGIGFGHAYVVYPTADLDAVPDKPVADPQAEAEAFVTAVADVARDIDAFATRIGSALRDEDRALFDAWRLMLESESLIDDTLARIRAGNWAQGALRATIAEHVAIFDQMDDLYLRERGSDVRDLGRQVLMRLQNRKATDNPYPERTILVGDEISAMQIAEVPRERLAGIVSTTGSGSSHMAILARGMGVPAAMGVAELPVSRIEGREMIVDGYRGRVYVSPSPSICAEYERLAKDDRDLSAELDALRGLPSQTTDGVRLPLFLNTGLVSEQRPLGIEESAGIGLYRTELPFLVRDRFPSENEQLRNYRAVLETFAPRPVTIRTLDIGGDKPLPYFPVQESNPFLGWRGIRITRDHPEIFITQVRAMLRAAVGLGNLRLLLPMVTTVEEVDDALLLIQRACDELADEGIDAAMPPVGVMIEVPAAVYQADAIARRVSFLSVGTNDLTQYLLAVDRNNAHVASLYDELHPAVLRALMTIVAGARLYGCEVSVCGEMAGDPLAAVLLLGIGVHNLSMSAGSLLRVKGVIRSMSRARSRELLRVALQCETGQAVRHLLTDALEEVGLGGLVRPGR
ncbi:phosphoenolpyruvate--protein phosphotransferase [Thiohalocapsa marina]|uniref:phosphoenolpyruvate--protein phosphotransferase n=1 Tax=Thiohalocapsa marina TaxID=424902 RepID=A0A5M8FRJ7_9GAMM|nr:phosphoenolpyruvate--protein phosphotransferase [Thiohalocapsa marina]KAA6185505.1 phosphoenolpyruvate--protein phosphotransferase [Thiohalocapsa marina]